MENNSNTEFQDVFSLAFDIALEAGSITVETNHLLLAIIRQKGSGYNELLGKVDMDGLIAALEDSIRQDPNKVELTKADKNLLKTSNAVGTALQIVRAANDQTSKGLLTAMIKQRGSKVAEALQTLSLDQDKQVIETIGSQQIANTATPTIDAYCVDLTELAKQNKLDPLVDRHVEVERILQVLGRRKKNNPVLVGESGVGKTAIVEGLAIKLVHGEIPPQLNAKKIVSLNLANLVAGTTLRGQFEERIKTLLSELVAHPDIILFIDEIHVLIGAGAQDGTGDAANLLKPALASGLIRCIGATTFDEYRMIILQDPALERRFQRIYVDPMSKAETEQVLTQLLPIYEEFHQVRYEQGAKAAIVELADRFIQDRNFPDKAIDLLDESGSVARLSNKPLVTVKMIKDITSSLTGIPVQDLNQTEKDKLLALEPTLNLKIVGQTTAIQILSNAIKRARTGLKSKTKPFSAMLLGPTGVGKTETARQLALHLFNTEDALIRLDMSEFQESHTVSKLIGAPPGYIGFEAGGQLTEQIRRRPYSVLLFDEIEKAHPDIYNALLQILDYGSLVDGSGIRADFSHAIILLTSNLGEHADRQQLGFNEQAADLVQKEIREKALKSFFKPEFLNRIDEVVYYNHLTKDNLREIIDLFLLDIDKIHLEITDLAKDYLLNLGYSNEYGARNLRRTIQTEIETPLADMLLNDDSIKSVVIDFADNKLTFIPENIGTENVNII